MLRRVDCYMATNVLTVTWIATCWLLHGYQHVDCYMATNITDDWTFSALLWEAQISHSKYSLRGTSSGGGKERREDLHKSLRVLRKKKIWTLKFDIMLTFLHINFDVLLTVHLSIILPVDQLNAQILFFNKFIIFLYMFRALLCTSSGGQIVLYSIWYRHTM